jgi:hypothetical protein
MVAQAFDRYYRSPPRYQRQALVESVAPRRNGLSHTEGAEAGPPDAAVVKYPYLRSVIDPQLAALPAQQLEALMENQFGPGAAEQYDEYFEGFFGDVGKWASGAARDVGHFATKAAPVVANIGGGVIRGATTGASLGLPGIIGGAIAGGVGQGFASYGSGTLRDIGKGMNSGISLAGQFTGTGRIGNTLGTALSGIGQGQNVMKTALGAASSLAGGAMGGSALGGSALGKFAGLAGGQSGITSALSGLIGGGQGGSAAGQLMGLLQRPEVLQSLGAMAMGSSGRPTIPVGSAQTPVPTSAFANLLGLLANRAADEQVALSDGSESNLRYLMDDAGEWVVDPSESEQRAAHLYYLLNAAEYERMVQAEQQLQMQQRHQQRVEQQQVRQQIAYQEQLRQARLWQRQQERETAIFDAVDLAEVYAFTDDSGEQAEFDEAALDEATALELEEYDAYANV